MFKVDEQKEGLPVLVPKETIGRMNILTDALVAAYTEAFQKLEQLLPSVNLSDLSEDERSGFILMKTVIKSYRKQESQKVFFSNNFLDQRELTSTAVNEIHQVVDCLSAWVPVLFKGYEEKFAKLPKQKLPLLAMMLGAYEIDKYFEEEGVHEFILDCLSLSRNKAFTVERSIGNNCVHLLDLDKILGNDLKSYRTSIGDKGFTILRAAVRRALVESSPPTAVGLR